MNIAWFIDIAKMTHSLSIIEFPGNSLGYP